MNTFEQENYKEVLKHIMDGRRQAQKGLSRKLAEHLNVHPTMVSQVMTGLKDFTEEQMVLVCEFLGLPKLESQYLMILLQQERAGSKKLKDYYQEQKVQIRKQALQLSERVSKSRHLSEAERTKFYSSWLYPAVHAMTTLNWDVRFETICEKFHLSKEKAREILDFLIQIQMIDEKNGVFKSGDVVTHLEKKSAHMVRHHTNWRLLAIQRAEHISDEELMYTACCSLSRKDFEIFREELTQLIQKFLKTVGPSPAEDIAQFNLDFFWIKN